MKNTIITTALIGIFTASITTSVVAAQDTVHFKDAINFSGTGCPTDISYRTSGENTDTISILFSQYDAANPPADASSNLQRSSCNFAVPVHIPAGWQISLLTSDWRGFAAGEAELHREYFFADQTSGMTLITPFNDLDGIDYTESDSLESSSYTACQSEDRDVMLRINSALQAKSDESYIGIDTIDMNNKVIFKLNSRTCRRDGLPFLPLLLLQGTN